MVDLLIMGSGSGLWIAITENGERQSLFADGACRPVLTGMLL
jgi:hypothetical protein